MHRSRSDSRVAAPRRASWLSGAPRPAEPPDAPGRRVVLFPSAYAPAVGGVEELTRRLAHQLRSAGDEVEVWTIRYPFSLAEEEVLDGFTVRRFHAPMPTTTLRGLVRFFACVVPALVRLAAATREARPDVFHVQCFSSNGIYATVLSRLFRVPLVISLQGETVMDDDDVYERSRALRVGLRLGLRKADVVTGCSQFVLDDAVNRFGLHPQRGIVVANGVDLEPTGRPVPLDLEFPRFVLGLGRVVPKKGFDLLIEAFALVAREDAEVGLVIAGDGRARSTLMEQARELGLEDRVSFPGVLGRGQVSWAMANASVFVLPSRVEPFGIVVLEALRAGAPAVVSSSGGAGEVVRDGQDGLVVDPTDTQAMAGAIARLLDNPSASEAMSAAGRLRAKEFSWDTLAGVYRDIYRRLAAPVKPNETVSSRI